MNFKVRHSAARLTAPAIPPQHFLAQILVGDGIEAKTWGLWADLVHDTFSPRLLRKVCFCASGRKRKNRLIENSRVSGSPLSRFAPARKSAQIISRQYPRDLSDPSIKAAVSMACSITGIWLLYSLK